eukprot:TRINITY_DN68010_c5_g1_i1.p1 TRINITY_DN68010_c5_g1~~TRINITY_DN68010_c5_g1_i1.p1  ORF type:complete len:551 (+),score=66.86 TRINITY_DN68010_c5_g1_i1:29-1681(+)
MCSPARPTSRSRLSHWEARVLTTYFENLGRKQTVERKKQPKKKGKRNAQDADAAYISTHTKRVWEPPRKPNYAELHAHNNSAHHTSKRSSPTPGTPKVYRRPFLPSSPVVSIPSQLPPPGTDRSRSAPSRLVNTTAGTSCTQHVNTSGVMHSSNVQHQTKRPQKRKKRAKGHPQQLQPLMLQLVLPSMDPNNCQPGTTATLPMPMTLEFFQQLQTQAVSNINGLNMPIPFNPANVIIPATTTDGSPLPGNPTLTHNLQTPAIPVNTTNSTEMMSISACSASTIQTTDMERSMVETPNCCESMSLAPQAQEQPSASNSSRSSDVAQTQFVAHQIRHTLPAPNSTSTVVSPGHQQTTNASAASTAMSTDYPTLANEPTEGEILTESNIPAGSPTSLSSANNFKDNLNCGGDEDDQEIVGTGSMSEICEERQEEEDGEAEQEGVSEEEQEVVSVTPWEGQTTVDGDDLPTNLSPVGGTATASPQVQILGGSSPPPGTSPPANVATAVLPSAFPPPQGLSQEALLTLMARLQAEVVSRMSDDPTVHPVSLDSGE